MRTPCEASSIVRYLIYILLNVLTRFPICWNEFRHKKPKGAQINIATIKDYILWFIFWTTGFNAPHMNHLAVIKQLNIRFLWWSQKFFVSCLTCWISPPTPWGQRALATKGHQEKRINKPHINALNANILLKLTWPTTSKFDFLWIKLTNVKSTLLRIWLLTVPILPMFTLTSWVLFIPEH